MLLMHYHKKNLRVIERVGKDNTYWTGLAYAKNLKSVRQQAAEEIASGINRKG